MVGKAKFDQEAAFKSIIGADRKEMEVAPVGKAKRMMDVCSVLTFLIKILIRLCEEWH